MSLRVSASRRAFLGWIVTTVLGFAGAGRASATAEALPFDVLDLFGSVFPRSTGAAMIGAEYLDRHPRESELHFLRHTLGLDPGVDLRAWSEWFARQRREDFHAEHVVEIRGWILAVTEARLCALAALAQRACVP